MNILYAGMPEWGRASVAEQLFSEAPKKKPEEKKKKEGENE
jgi:hypothetical protein